jgi:nucleotide-binding universal stress UspA family protein
MPMQDKPFVRSVLHPSDFSESSHTAFVHALAVVLYRQAILTVLHVEPRSGSEREWTDSPRVRETLERWGILEPDSPRSAVYDKLAIKVSKIGVKSSDPVKAIVAELEYRNADLCVLSTEGRNGLPRWWKPSVAEGIARRSKTMTLFVPSGSDGFVSEEDGKIGLKRILLPVDHRPDPQAAVTFATRAALMSHEESVEISLLRVGDPPDWPAVDTPEMQSCSWKRIHRPGEVVEGIVSAAEDGLADLIVMATEGTHGILDALRGTVTEQVVRRAGCPVLAVPAGRH